MLGGIAGAIAIIFFVTAHEAGHFLAAKAVGMKATQFFFGFGPKIWSTQRGETEYGFKLLPLGGYVRIVGMNPLEDVDPEDMGRTYREKKFWEKSVVVLAGVGTNFLMAFLLFFGVIWANGITEPTPGVREVVATTSIDGVETVTPAAAAGLQVGDTLLSIDGSSITTWEDVPRILSELGSEQVEVVVYRDGGPVTLTAELVERTTPEGRTAFLGVAPEIETREVSPISAVGMAGQQVWDGIGFTFGSLRDMVRPSSLVQYIGVFGGDTEVDDEIRPVSPIGIVNIGSQAQDAGAFLGILAFVNVILATLNLLPLFPLDGGHFAVALYEKVTGREANIRRLMPIAAAVVGLFAFLGVVAIILDIVQPISL